MGFLDQFKVYIILGLVVALVGLGVWHVSEVAVYKHKVSALQTSLAEAQGQVAQLKVDLKTATDANKAMEVTIERQNSSIQQWMAEATKRKDEASKALKKAQVEGAQWKAKYGVLLSRPPANPKDECSSLNERLDEYLAIRGTTK